MAISEPQLLPGAAVNWVLLELHAPGQQPQKIGILLVDCARDALHVRFRCNWWSDLADNQAEVWATFAEDLAIAAADVGAQALLEDVAQSASHVIRVGKCGSSDQAPDTVLDVLWQREQMNNSALRA